MSLFNLEVCRVCDGITVARTSPRTLPEGNREHGAIRADARKLSAVYGNGFYVEVWVWDPVDPMEYYRAYVMDKGKTVCAVGF